MGTPRVKEKTYSEAVEEAHRGGEGAVSSNHEVGSEVRDAEESTLGVIDNTSGTLK